MRWLWIDKFTEFEPRTRAVAVKNLTLAEEHLHDQSPDFPIVPHSLVIEGMAQTAGILVGQAFDFKEKVILAKISRATFHRLARPGDTLTFETRIEHLSEHGATCAGTVKAGEDVMADIQLMFSHVDRNLAGVQFPRHNFVFDGQLMQLVSMGDAAGTVVKLDSPAPP